MQILVQATLLPHGQKAWKPVAWKIGRIKNIELVSMEKRVLAAIPCSLSGSPHPSQILLPNSPWSQDRDPGKATY